MAAEQPAEGCAATAAALVAFAFVVVVDAGVAAAPAARGQDEDGERCRQDEPRSHDGILARPLRRGTSHPRGKVPSLLRMTELGELLIDALTALSGAHPGYRAAHAQGVCASGTFTGTAAAADLSRAVHLAGGPVRATVRFSNGNGDPDRADGEPDGRGMAVQLRADDGTSYDLVALSLPVFFVRTVEDFLAFTSARVPDPATGAPDPERVGAFITAHPESLPAVQASLVAQPPASYVAIPYYGIHAFRFVDAAGVGRFAAVPLGARRDGPTAHRSGAAGRGAPLPRRGAGDAPRGGTGVVHARPAARRARGRRARSHDRVAGDPRDGGGRAAGAGHLRRRRVRRRHLRSHAVVDGVECSDDPILHARSEAYGVSYAHRSGT